LSRLAEDRILTAYGITPALRARIAGTPEKLEVIKAVVFAPPMSRRRAGFNNDMSHFRGLPDYPMEEIRVPTFVMHGTADSVVPHEHGETVARRVPDAQILRIDGGGHLCVVTHKEIVIPTVMNFLEERGLWNDQARRAIA
jgi:pimeloyl-ACP methyl ester carboxylesterase